MASPAPSGKVSDDSKPVEASHTSNNFKANERAQYQPTQNYGYSDGANGMGPGMGARQWADYSAFGKLDANQYMVNAGMRGGDYEQQDEANFVQSFAVQQPFLPYSYLTGFQPFGNQLYSQFGYGFGHPFSDPNQFIDGQAYFGMPDGAGSNTTRDMNPADGLQSGGEQQFFMDPLQLYQFGNTFANLSLHDPQDQRLLQQQLYQHQLMQLQQQQQQLQQQLLQTSQQLALQTGRDVDGNGQVNTTGQSEIQPPQTPQEEDPLQEEQQEEREKTNQETEIQKEENPPPPQPSQQPKQEGPKSWADILNAAPSKPPPQPSAKQASSLPVSPTNVPPSSSNSVDPAAGAIVVVKTKPGQESNHRADEGPKVSSKMSFNPINFDFNVSSARFFVIKSYSEDDIHKSIKYNVWASTDSGNRRLDTAYRESATSGPIYLFYSVNASGQFCGMARMTSALDYSKKCELWAQDKWNGQFTVHWIFIKDIPNAHLRHIRLTNNENKPVTNSRDTQEIFLEPGREMLRIFTTYNSKTSILDDFSFYDKRQELMKEKKDLPDETGTLKPDSLGSELPIATGENRKQRVSGTGRVTSPQTQHSNYTSGSSPQSYSKGSNGTTTTKAPTQQRGKR